MKRKSFSPVMPAGTPECDPHLGFTIWVHLARPNVAADVQIFRRGLDRYLDASGLTRSLNPLHTLIWSPQRSLTPDDQISLLVWMVADGRAVGFEIGALQHHSGIPAQRDRVAQLPAMLGDRRLLPLADLYRSGRMCVDQFVELLGGYRPPVTLH